MRIAQEEVFGPILSIIPFEDEAEAVKIGNDIVYGLAAGGGLMILAEHFVCQKKTASRNRMGEYI